MSDDQHTQDIEFIRATAKRLRSSAWYYALDDLDKRKSGIDATARELNEIADRYELLREVSGTG